MKRRNQYNSKREIREKPGLDLPSLASKISYSGNPEHKRNPGDFGFPPLLPPRADKSLCDDAGIFTRAEATRLLRAGVEAGLISEQTRNGYPQNIWVVTDENVPLEAQLTNQSQGVYHGYPLAPQDPFREIVLKRHHAARSPHG